MNTAVRHDPPGSTLDASAHATLTIRRAAPAFDYDMGEIDQRQLARSQEFGRTPRT